MTRLVRVEPDPMELMNRFREYLDDPARAEDRTTMLRAYEEFLHEFTEYAEVFAEMTAWCRLAVGMLRGEDVPTSIHVPADEAPADTARWQKWRVS